MESYQALERELANWSGFPTECVVAVSSGTAAIHLALEALQLPHGSEVIVPDYTMIACARAVTLAGLKPVLVDCKSDSLLLNPENAYFNSKRSNDCRAILAVHIYGRRCDMSWLSDIAGSHGLFLVEDMAEAHGVKPHESTDAAVWSFYANKIVHGAEGGAVAFRDPEHAARARQLRCLGFTERHDFQHVPRGHNYRLANLLAEPIRMSLACVNDSLAARRQIEARYDAACPDAWRMPRRDVVWVFDVRIPGLKRQQQAEIVRALNAAGVAARMGFLPMSQQEEYRNCRVVGTGNARRAADEVFYLPCTPAAVTEADAQRALTLIRQCLASMQLAQ